MRTSACGKCALRSFLTCDLHQPEDRVGTISIAGVQARLRFVLDRRVYTAQHSVRECAVVRGRDVDGYFLRGDNLVIKVHHARNR